jgi:septal ring factor EnvC (AmiA/AmiB activator)
MAIQEFESQEAMDDAFEDQMEASQDLARLKEYLEGQINERESLKDQLDEIDNDIEETEAEILKLESE